MPLPIPDIMENASAVLTEAKAIINLFGDKPEFEPLKKVLKKVNKDDLLAVMNEIGRVYVGIHNVNVIQVGSRANLTTKMLEVMFNADFGLGPRPIVIGLDAKGAEEFTRNVTANFTALSVDAVAQPGAANKLILK